MARQRFIHPEFWTDPSIGKLTPVERLFFIGCFSNADDEGRLLGNPAYLRSIIFPYDDMSIDEVKAIRDAVVARCRNLVLYEVDGVECLAFTKWDVYQKPKYPQPSKLPPPPNCQTKPVARWYVPKAVRERVLERYGHRCARCGATDDLEIDHIVPLKHGGTSDESNLQVLCARCNNRKGNKVEAGDAASLQKSADSEDGSTNSGQDSTNLEKALLPGLGLGLGLGTGRVRVGLGEGVGEPTPPPPPDATPTELAVLRELKAVAGYPFDYAKDLDFVRSLAVDFADLDVLDETKKWATYKRDRPLSKKSNPRLQLRNWLTKAREFARERRAKDGRNRGSGRNPPTAGKYDDLVVRDSDLPLP